MKATSADTELKTFLDTSILIAAFYGDHQHHAASLELFLGCDKRTACCGAHSLAEVYSALTRMPGKRRVAGDDAVLFLADIRDRLSMISLDEREYYRCIRGMELRGLPPFAGADCKPCQGTAVVTEQELDAIEKCAACEQF